jgi:hypothetical protein
MSATHRSACFRTCRYSNPETSSRNAVSGNPVSTTEPVPSGETAGLWLQHHNAAKLRLPSLDAASRPSSETRRPGRNLAIRKANGERIGQEIPDGNRGGSYAAASAAITHRVGAAGIVQTAPRFRQVSRQILIGGIDPPSRAVLSSGGAWQSLGDDQAALARAGT